MTCILKHETNRDPGGRIRKDEIDYLGSVRTVLDGAGNTKTYDYYPYGTLRDGVVLNFEANPLLFNGKEMQTIAGTNLYDYGARFYNPRTGMWLTRDPLAEDYKEYSPYVFCAGNPVNLVDSEGESTYVVEEGIDRYSVVDGGDPDDGDDNIYAVTKDSEGNIQRGRSIGRSATPYSFYDSTESGWKAIPAYIDLTDDSAFRFTDYFVDNDISLLDYIRKARNYGLFDFKETTFDENEVGIHHEESYKYRGMPISRGKKPIIASARDVGNIVAGYMSADNHIPYFLHRLRISAMTTQAFRR